jgi:hypothetical protein
MLQPRLHPINPLAPHPPPAPPVRQLEPSKQPSNSLHQIKFPVLLRPPITRPRQPIFLESEGHSGKIIGWDIVLGGGMPWTRVLDAP